MAIAGSLGLVTLVLTGLRAFYPVDGIAAQWLRVPVSIIALEFLLSLTGSVSARALRRLIYEWRRRQGVRVYNDYKRLILYGAGEAGIQLLRELRGRPDMEVAGFVDDDPRKVGTVIAGAKVLGSGESLENLVYQAGVDEVVISLGDPSPATVARITARCNGLPVKIIPSRLELMSGRVHISQMRDVSIKDLLGRGAVELSKLDQGTRQTYEGKRILVTGAGGSIGSELVRQLIPANPETIAILDKDENSVYELEQELVQKGSAVHIDPYIADIRHVGRLHGVFSDFKPQLVFHAAAHKHVPLMERHPPEAVLNNVCGTQNLLEVARAHGVEQFVYISSDKAVNPVNVMGATKRIGEMLVQSYARTGSMRAACVRFGNVMGSRGSVVPLFMKQIARGGPITVTHPDIVRFFMTIPEAVQLVLCAGTLANRGEVFVLEMGSPRRILELAHRMIQLAGLEPGKDIQVSIVGLRPGEKLSEELTCANESLSRTRFEKISMIKPRPFNDAQFLDRVLWLVRTAERNNASLIYEVLTEMDLGFFAQPGLAHRNGRSRLAGV
jgi:FlaA1/EpsC-like NDP-sugar epimerase